MIAMYDLEDNFIMMFDSFEECAEYFGKTKNHISCIISKIKSGRVDKVLDKTNNKWVRLFKIEKDKIIWL